MTFGELYETLENIDVRVVDDKKGYYAKDPDFDYDSIAGREIERIFVDVVGNLVVELKYQSKLMVKDLLSAYVGGKGIRVVWTGCIQYLTKEECLEKYDDRKVKKWKCEPLNVSIMIDGEMLP